MQLKELADYNASLLQTGLFKDYCPNGIQVEGRGDVARIATAVTASLAVLEAAILWGADALLVHHGYFWRGESAEIVGLKKRRLATLLQHDVSLLTYHLPLDAHPTLGNNAQLGQRLGLTETGRCGPQNMICLGNVTSSIPLKQFAQHVTQTLGKTPLLLGDETRTVQRVAWCSGGAQGYFEEAITQDVDVFLTGEVSEQCFHLAHETGVGFIAAGHHATERWGIQALGAHLADHFGLQHAFFDQDNPV